jgi:AICAR transformylase/IMP cyclohydrolase PurH
MDVKIRTALVSVSDKSGVVEFAKKLAEKGVKIISTGGTAKKLGGGGVEVVWVFVTRPSIKRRWISTGLSRLIWCV